MQKVFQSAILIKCCIVLQFFFNFDIFVKRLALQFFLCKELELKKRIKSKQLFGDIKACYQRWDNKIKQNQKVRR